MNEWRKMLKKFGLVKTNVPLSKLTTFKIGAPAALVLTIENFDNLSGALAYLNEEGIDYMILGGGSNVLMPDEPYEGVVVKIGANKISVDNDEIFAESGALLSGVVQEATKNSLTGLEWAVGIPGTLGGAVRGNAGAMGKDMGKNIVEVKAWINGEIVTLTNSECNFGYRTSCFKTDGGIILSAKIKLARGEPSAIMRQVQEYLFGRQEKFPRLPSAGSFFQNVKITDWPGDKNALPPIYLERGSIPAGYLVEQCGLKGSRLGGAGVALEHGNFIVNHGDATRQDVLKLVEKVQEAVYNKFGVALVSEVEIIS
jgi:UDP-N-acetylmuramate dehydrogenase